MFCLSVFNVCFVAYVSGVLFIIVHGFIAVCFAYVSGAIFQAKKK